MAPLYVFDRATGVFKFVSRQPDARDHVRSYYMGRAALVQHEITHGDAAGRTADTYFGLKDEVRRLYAKADATTARAIDPVGAWHDMQSA